MISGVVAIAIPIAMPTTAINATTDITYRCHCCCYCYCHYYYYYYYYYYYNCNYNNNYYYYYYYYLYCLLVLLGTTATTTTTTTSCHYNYLSLSLLVCIYICTHTCNRTDRTHGTWRHTRALPLRAADRSSSWARATTHHIVCMGICL